MTVEQEWELKTERLKSLVLLVVEALGSPWKMSSHDAKHESSYWVHIEGENSERLSFIFGTGTRGADEAEDRITVSGSYPRCADGDYLTPSSHPSISVRVDRGPAVMARDIQRRLLSDYRVVLAEVLARKAESDSFADIWHRNMARLAVAFGAKLPSDPKTQQLDVPKGQLWVGRDVTINRLYVTVDQALKIAAILKK